MRSGLTKVSLALLSALLVLGCQDQGPVGPEGLEPQFGKVKNCDPPEPIHRSCKPDPDPDPDPSTSVDLTGGMIAIGLPVDEGKDVTKSFSIGNPDQEKKPIQMAFTDVGGISCVGIVTNSKGRTTVRGDGVFELLLEQLIDVVPAGKWTMNVEKAGDHNFVRVEYTDGDHLELGTIRIGLGGPWSDVPSPEVELTMTEDGDDVYTFTGSVSVWANFSRGNQSQVIKCPDQTVVVTIHQ